MTINTFAGPSIGYGVTLTSSGGIQEWNEERGPSLQDLGEGLLDPRPQFSFKPGSRSGYPVYGWAGLFGGPVVDATPVTFNTSGIAVTQSATAGGNLTLAGTSQSSSFTITSIVPATGNAAVSVLAIDGAMAGKAFGTAGTINLWDPTKAISRCLSVTINASQDYVSSGVVTINGYDLYGFAMTSAIALSSAAATANISKKAIKYVSSISLSTAITWTSTSMSVGTTDTWGFPLRVDHPAYVTAWWGPSSNAQLVLGTSAGLHTFASTATAASSTSDVRGTFSSTWMAAGNSNSTAAAPNKLVVFISPSVQNLASVTNTDFSGIVGVSQA